MTQWLEEVHDHLGLQTEAIRAALEDVRELCGEPAIGWVVRPRGHDGEVTVYVLAEGILHKVSGRLDQPPDGRDPGARTESVCEYKIQPLNDAASYTATVTTELGPAADSWTRRGTARGTVRTWLFTGLGEFEDLRFESPRQPHIGPDPTPFAKALAAQILKIKRPTSCSGATENDGATRGDAA